MKAVILAGGFGTRISEETYLKPKPLIEIGGMPLLWHIMKIYSAHGINDFVICCGYKGYMIKEYFANYFLHMSDVTFDIKNNKMEIHQMNAEPWTITLIDTGDQTMTGGRIKRIEKYVDDTFCLTYGDGLSDVNITKLIEFHKKNKTIATVSAVQPPGRFGSLFMEDHKVTKFVEKPPGDSNWINGGFFVIEPEFFDFIEGDQSILEQAPLEKATAAGELMAYQHEGYWQCMDTKRDRDALEALWDEGNPPWLV